MENAGPGPTGEFIDFTRCKAHFMNVAVASSPGPNQNFLYVLIRAAYQFYVLLFTTAYSKQWQLQVSQQYFKSILPVPKQTLIPKFSILRTSRVPDDSL